MIRSAKAADIMAIIALFREAHARSGRTEDIDEKYAREEILLKAMFYDGPRWDRHPLGTHVMVAEREGAIVGIHIGVKARVAVIGRPLYATDLLFYVSKRACPFMAAALVADFEAWAEKDPRVIQLRPGANSDVDDWHQAAAFYEKLGYTAEGAILGKRIERREKVAA